MTATTITTTTASTVAELSATTNPWHFWLQANLATAEERTFVLYATHLFKLENTRNAPLGDLDRLFLTPKMAELGLSREVALDALCAYEEFRSALDDYRESRLA